MSIYKPPESEQRKAFEAWYEDNNTNANLLRSSKGYIDDKTRVAWRAWQAAVQPAPVQERTNYAVHLNHCNIGECYGVCKYGDDDCPALKHADMKAKWDRPTPPAAPVQEPVLWLVNGVVQVSNIPADYTGCLYTTPPYVATPPAARPALKPLTPAQVHDIWVENHTPQEVVSAVEAAHGIKE